MECTVDRLLYIILFSSLPVAATGWAGSHTVYTTKDGMPDNYVTCLMQDRTGYLWIGTNSGLARYDGYTFNVFKHNPRDSNSIAGNTITCLYEDVDGCIWIGTYNKGLSRFNTWTEKFTNYIHKDTDSTSIAQNTVYSIYRDSRNRLWFGLAGKGLDRLDEAKHGFVHHSFMGNSIGGASRYANIIRDIKEDSKGNLWMCSQYGLHCIEARSNTKWTIKLQGNKDNTHYTALFVENDTSFWLGTWAHGIRHINPVSGQYRDYLCNRPDFTGGTTNVVTDIVRKSSEELWVSSYDSGLCSFNKSTGLFLKEIEKPEGRNFAGLNLLQDKAGNLWIGTELNGLIKYKPVQNVFQTYVVPPVSPYPDRMSIADITKDRTTNTYYLYPVFGKGVMIADKKFSKIECVPYLYDQSQTFSVSDVLHDRRDRIWMNANSSLLMFNPATKKYKSVRLTADDGTVLSYTNDMKEDSRGNIWFCNAAGIFRLDTKGALKHFVPYVTDRDILNDMHAMYIDREDNIWICNSFFGLARYFPATNRLENYMPIPGDERSLSQSSLMNMVQDAQGTYWIATMGSGICLMRLDKHARPVFSDFSANNKLDDAVLDVATDKGGNVWISDKNKIHVYLEREDKLISFDETNGLSENFRGGNIFTDDDGTVLFNAHNEVQRIAVGNYKRHTYPPPVVLTSFKINGETFSADTNINYLKNIRLNHDQNFISFEVAALNYGHAGQNTYAYKLEGLETRWNYIGERRNGSYTDIKPGQYTLLIKAADGNDVWNNTSIALGIFIEPPFWQTWWFYATVAMLFMLITTGIYRYRLKVMKEREKIKSEFNKKVAEVEMTALRAQMNPHFLFNCLNSINKYVLMNDRDAASEYLTSFAKLIRLILDNSKQESVSLENELQALGLYIEMEALRFENLFEYKIDVADDIIPADINIPPLLFQPFVENAIWHGLMYKNGPGFISVSVRRAGEMLVVTIEDNGVGRAKAKEYQAGQTVMRKSHGMQITSDRINILNKLNNSNALVEIIDLFDDERNAAGTKVIITLPVLYAPRTLQQNKNFVQQ